MLKTYFILAYRNLVSNRTTSLINVVGLSIALACAITVFLILKNFWTLDSFHTKGDRIFMVEYTREVDNETEVYGDAPAPIAAALRADFPQVKQTVRVQREGVQVLTKGSVVDELITYADTNFFHLFTFPLKYGSPTALADPAAIILSSEMAEKYFPNQIPIGQPFTIITASREHKQFVVRGVAETFPNNIGFAFALLTGYHSVHDGLKNQDWTTHISGVFVEVPDKRYVPTLARQLDRYVALYNSKNTDEPITSFVFDNLRNPAPKAYDVRRRPAEANHPMATLIFSAIALLMMGVSCFNYINISLGAVTQRLKEIGVRKVMGGTRQQLIVQFMIENLLLCFIALLLSLLITTVFLIPLFNDLMVMTISLAFSQNAPLWLFMAGILLFTAVASGGYPALYVSAFRPIAVFAGRQKFGNKGAFSRVLLVGQFVLAFVAVIVGVVFTSAGIQWKNLDWGYNPDQTLAVRLTDSTQYTILRNELVRNPAVSLVAGAEYHVGESMALQAIRVGDRQENVVRYNVGPGYFETLGLQLATGQFFDEHRLAENAESVVVNETFVRHHRWKDGAIGKTIRVDQQVVTIAGVVRDFKLFGSGVARPAVFFSARQPQYQYLALRFDPNHGPGVKADLERLWQSKFPNTTVSMFYQKEVFDAFNTTFQNLANGFGYLAGLALLIACMGLYGLAAQHFAKRLKEVGVRKVLGASVANILLLVNREFVLLLLMAGVVANAITMMGVQLTLQNTQEFTGSYRPGLLPYLAANALVLLTAAFAVSMQSWKMANVQLSTVLKNNE
ncbi:ABC transporter permease [Spirosoma sp. SC4-14]|uniref:ABC transporter permease n=1 Tax=Spirosoma sp. SC4-14 TaxID=3128900 RepID=UPI0030D37993